MNSIADHLYANGALRSPRILEAFRTVDRADFLPEDQQKHALEDRPLPIGRGQTNSQPSTVAFMLEKLQPKQGEYILDVGAGSGWTTALLARIVGFEGRVYGVELLPELVEFARSSIAAYGYDHAEIISAGETFGLPEYAPFDKILVSAAADEIPEELVDQLGAGGRMLIAVKHSIMQVDKSSDEGIDTREYPGFAFVPLRRSLGAG